MAGKKLYRELGLRVRYADPVAEYKRELRENPTVRDRSTGRYIRYSAKEYKRRIKLAALAEQVKKMRPYFGEMFRAGSGYDLRKVAAWTPAQKKKVSQYWRVMAPMVSRDHKAKFYKNKQNLEAAIRYTQQERILPGQRAALFEVVPGETLDVKVERGRVSAKRNRVTVKKVFFDPRRFIADPVEELERALDELEGAKLYKLMFGPHESRGTFTSRGNIVNTLLAFISRYGEDLYDPEDSQSHYFGNWLGGVIGYFGRKDEVTRKVTREDVLKAASAVERVRERRRERDRIRRRVISEAAKRGRKKKG